MRGYLGGVTGYLKPGGVGDSCKRNNEVERKERISQEKGKREEREREGEMERERKRKKKTKKDSRPRNILP